MVYIRMMRLIHISVPYHTSFTYHSTAVVLVVILRTACCCFFRGLLLQYVYTGQGFARGHVVSFSTPGYGRGVFCTGILLLFRIFSKHAYKQQQRDNVWTVSGGGCFIFAVV